MILLTIVLFLESWKTLGIVLGKRRYKFMGVNILILSLLTLGLSRWNVINVKSIDTTLLTKNPISK